MEKNNTKPTYTKIETVDDNREGYVWKTKIEYENNKFTEDEVTEAKLMAKLLFETHKVYYNNPPTHVDILLRDRTILDSRHVEVEVTLTDENASRRGFKLSDFDWEFEEVLANHFETKRFELPYDLKKKYSWTISELDVGSGTFVLEAVFDIK